MRSDIVSGMADILWGSAWADAMEEIGRGRELSGREITSIMPATPASAYRGAELIARSIEQANGQTLEELYRRALRADADDNGGRHRHEDAERFGGDLAHMSMGSGVSWFDDHAKFPLKVPHTGESVEDELRMVARDREEGVWLMENPIPTGAKVALAAGGAALLGILTWAFWPKAAAPAPTGKTYTMALADVRAAQGKPVQIAVGDTIALTLGPTFTKAPTVNGSSATATVGQSAGVYTITGVAKGDTTFAFSPGGLGPAGAAITVPLLVSVS